MFQITHSVILLRWLNVLAFSYDVTNEYYSNLAFLCIKCRDEEEKLVILDEKQSINIDEKVSKMEPNTCSLKAIAREIFKRP